MGISECRRHLIYLRRVEARFENFENVQAAGVSRRVLYISCAARCSAQKNCPRETVPIEPQHGHHRQHAAATILQQMDTGQAQQYGLERLSRKGAHIRQRYRQELRGVLYILKLDSKSDHVDDNGQYGKRERAPIPGLEK